MLAIIAGTGFYNWDLIENQRQQVVETPYGEAEVYLGSCKGQNVAFLPRHSKNHSIPPHLINYRANLYALKSLGITKIVAINAVGSLDINAGPGAVVLVDDFLDYTWGRDHTYFTGGKSGVGHVDMTNCYCPALQADIIKAAHKAKIELYTNGIYVATQGPRFETRAEIQAFAKLGGTVVGMTGVPEVCLANELGICYASLAMVTNYGCGIGKELDGDEISTIMDDNKEKLEQILSALVDGYTEDKNCSCGSGRVFKVDQK